MRKGSSRNRRLARLTQRRAGSGLPWQPGRRQVFILPTRSGVVLGLCLLVMLLGALNYNNNLALAFTFLLISLFMRSAAYTNRHLEHCRLLELEALPVHAGQTLVARLWWRQDDPEFPPTVEADGIQCQSRSDHATLRLTAHRRGWLELPMLKLTSRYPFGLFQAWTWWRHQGKLLIWPRVEKTPPPLPSHCMDQSPDGRQLPQGDLTELSPWQAGEPLSRVAWKILARHGQMLSRHPEPAGEKSGPIVLRLADTGLNDRESAISRLTAWILEAERRSIPYGLDLGSGEILAPALGERHLYQCLERLALA